MGGFWTIYFKSLVTKLLSWLTRTRSEFSWFLPTKALIASSFWLRGWTCFHFSSLIHPLPPPSNLRYHPVSSIVFCGFVSWEWGFGKMKNVRVFQMVKFVPSPPKDPSSGPKTGAASSRGGDFLLRQSFQRGWNFPLDPRIVQSKSRADRKTYPPSKRCGKLFDDTFLGTKNSKAVGSRSNFVGIKRMQIYLSKFVREFPLA